MAERVCEGASVSRVRDRENYVGELESGEYFRIQRLHFLLSGNFRNELSGRSCA